MNTHNLLITVGTLGTIEIYNQLDNSANDNIETLIFADTSTFALSNTPSLTTYGSDGNDSIVGVPLMAGSNDTIYGLDGADMIDGKGGNDTIDGGAGNDDLRGDSGNDTFIASAGFDEIQGYTGTDTLVIPAAYGANDLSIFRDAGNDTHLFITIAGLGQVQLTYQFSIPNNITEQITFANGVDTAINLTTASILTVGSDGNDNFSGISTGASTNDVLDGRAGDDTLNAGDGNDTLKGGAGNDTLNGGDNTDTADYSTASAGVTVSLAAGTATGEGSDTLSNIENATGSGFADTLTGNSSANVLSDGAGNDMLSGGAGGDTLDGGIGTDTADYTASASAVTVDLQNATASGGDAASDTLTGIENVTGSNTAADIIYGDANANTIDGLGGNDFLEGGAGADVIDGGAGWDTVRYTRSTSGVTVNLATNVSTGGHAAGDLLYNIEALVGSNYDDTLIGNANINSLTGGSGNDILDGRDGNDTLAGGIGTDTASYTAAASGVTVSLATGTATGQGSDTLTDIENITGSAYADTLTGNGSANVLAGGAGGDALDGGGGTDTADYTASTAAVTIDLQNGTASGGDAASDTLTSIENVTGSNTAAAIRDTIYGDANANAILGLGGNDILEGGGGADTIDGGADWDTVRYTRSASGVTVNLATNVNTGGDAASDLLYNIEAVVGSNHNDSLTGGSGADTLQGGAGNDSLTGGSGDDVMDGGTGTGNDSLTGEDGTDTASYALASSGVTVSLAAGTATGQGSDTLATIENVTGSAHADTLTGDANANMLQGGAGNDQIGGGGGADILYGQGDADTFIFLAASAYGAIDTIKDFSTAQSDKLDLSDLLSAYNPLTDDITHFVEITTSGSNSILKVDANGTTGGASFVQIATLEGITGLTNEATLEANGTLITA